MATVQTGGVGLSGGTAIPYGVRRNGGAGTSRRKTDADSRGIGLAVKCASVFQNVVTRTT